MIKLVAVLIIGKTRVGLRVKKGEELVRQEELSVVVIRKGRIIDKVFTISVATLVAIIYINFGCALQWKNLWSIIKSPGGPLIGLTGQFLVMPVVSKIIILLTYCVVL